MQLDQKTSEEVDSKRKKDRPKYFSSELGDFVEISEDMESFLILLKSEAKTQAASWISSTSSTPYENVERDDFLDHVIAEEESCYNEVLDKYSDTLGKFEGFRSTFSVDGAGNVAEAGIILDDLQSSVGEISHDKEEFNHNKSVMNNIKSKYLSGVNEDKKRQLQSWLPLLLSY